MKLELHRKVYLEDRTLGELYVNGVKFCDTLEDRDRGLGQALPLEQNIALKIKKQTAIPKGEYVVVISFSNRFQKLLPELLSVPAFGGIRIHPGNAPEDTDGCILVGRLSNNKVVSSRDTFGKLFTLLVKANKTEKITIEVY